MTLPERILIAGFSNIGKTRNPSADIASTLSVFTQVEFNANIKFCVLPACQEACTIMMKKAIKSYMPDLIIIIGTHSGDETFEIEALANNTLCLIPGVKGNEEISCHKLKEAIYGADDFLETTFDVDLLSEKMNLHGLDTIVTEEPSSFACNQAYFVSLYETLEKDADAILINVPMDAFGSHNISRRLTDALAETIQEQAEQSDAQS